MKTENEEFLTEQLITYLGNKRKLLEFIGKKVKKVQKQLDKEKLDIFDVFSGSGVVSRYFKQFAENLYTNDLEGYAKTINKCYLTNREDVDEEKLDKLFDDLNENLTDDKLKKDGFIRRLYSPKDEKNIKINERVFYTERNAAYIDTARQLIEKMEEPYKTLFLGPLLYEASIKNNTAGTFKGFYKNSESNKGQYGGNNKNALNRILCDIEIKKPIFSNFNPKVKVLQGDSNKICKEVPQVDLAYLDPPYNQHPYGSNYFMLNLINEYKEPKEISKVSGIPKNWNRSKYNKKQEILKTLEKLCKDIKAKFILVSYNSEGFVSFNEIKNMLKKIGEVQTAKQKYNVFRGCRNLKNRSIHLYEYLFLLKKE